jgi:hypothetical protein
MKKKFFGFLGVLAAISFLVAFVGCRPYNKPRVVQVEANETAFIVDARGETEAVQKDSLQKVNKRDIEIYGYWVKTGRFHTSGYWRPLQRVIVVTRKPVEVHWSDSPGTPTIKVASKESVGFTVPIVVNATILDEDAATYLNWFPAKGGEDSRNGGDVSISDGREASWENIRLEAEPLESAINRVLYPYVNGELAKLFIEKSIIEAEVSSKQFVELVEAEAIKKAKEYGITLILMKATDGIIYDDPQFQKALDDRALAFVKKDALELNEANRQIARNTEMRDAQTQAQVAATKASTIDVERRRQEIENSRMIAEAEAEAIKIRASKWNGAYPTTVTPEFGLKIIQ